MNYLYKKIRQIVGDDIAMYNFHQPSMNKANTGNIIKPILQKNSNTIDVIILAGPFVMSTTESKFVEIEFIHEMKRKPNGEKRTKFEK